MVRIEAAPINPSDLGLLVGAADMATAKASGSKDAPVITAEVPAAAMKGMAGRLDESMPVGNEGAGVVVQTGSSDAAKALMGKTVALIGGAPAGASFSLDHMSTLWGKRVVGILGGEGRSASLIGALIALNKQGRFPYDKLITSFPLDQVNDALEASRAGDVIKPVLRMPE